MKTEKPKTIKKDTNEELMEAVEFLKKQVADQNEKIEMLTSGKDDRFKKDAKSEDIKSGEIGREGVDERIVKIVDDILGKDFGIEFGQAEGPGMRLTIIVPERLSLIPDSERPIKEANGAYKRDANDRIINEVYKPLDKRSRSMATGSDFGVIRKHCEMVLANIVSTYSKLHKPLPEFKITKYN